MARRMADDVAISMEYLGGGSITINSWSATDKNGRTLLHRACLNNDYDEVAKLLQKGGVNIIATDKNKRTPLHHACLVGNEKIVGLLIQKSAECLAPALQGNFIDLTDEKENTPLGIASYKGHTQVAELLMNHGADMTHTNSQKNTPLGIACYKGHTQVAELLLNHGADVTHTNSQKRTPLSIACIEGHTEIVQLLLNHGANVNVIDNNQNTPLGNASIPGHTKVVELILKHRGADINHTDNDHDTMLGIACIGGHTEIVKLFLEHGGADINHVNKYKRTPLIMSCIKGHTEIIELLLKHGANLNATDSHNDIALGVACIKGHTQVVELLLKHGADIEHINKYKRTPLVMTCIEGHTEIVKLLLKHGAEVNITDDDNDTPLGIACLKGSTEVVEMLLKHGADITHTDKHKRTPLVMTCIEGHTEIVKLLLKHGANINVTDSHNDTPLGIACKKGHTQIVELLLKHDGADNNINNKNQQTVTKHGKPDINHINAKNQTPLVMACVEGHTQIVEMLLKHGADINHTDKDKNKPLGIACSNGHTEIVKLLLDHEADVNVTDDNNHTIIYNACKEGRVQVIELFLEKENADFTKCDEEGLNPLDIAVEKGHKDAAMAIVKSDKHWKKALRNLTVLDERDDINRSAVGKKFNGIRRIWCCKRKSYPNDSTDERDDHDDTSRTQFTTPMRRIINKMPDVAKVIFERCCEKEAPQDHPNHKITFNYEFLDDFDHEWSKQSKYSSQNHCLNILANSQSADLLQHPLATALLNKKWRKIGQKFYYSNLTVYFLFVILLTSFALTLHSPNSTICMEVFGNDTSTFTDCSPEESLAPQRYISFASVCLIIYSAIMILREVFQMIQFRLQYFTSFVNFFEILLFILTIMFASVRSSDCYCTRSWQWQVGVIAVFLSWIALIFSIRKLPIVGIYVVMFIKIFNNFVKVVLLALLLIFAFGVPFYMMFYDPQDGIDGIRTPFITPWRTIMKTVIMTEGEYDMDSILRQNNQMSSPDIQYPVVAFSLIVVFVILMPILFLNLLTGLAVGDTQEIQKSADTYRLVLRVEFTLPIEEFLRSILQSPRLPKRVKRSLDSWKKTLVNDKEEKEPNKRNIFKQKYDEIKQSVSTDQETVADVKNQLSEEIKELRLEVRSSVSQEVKDLRSSMDQLLAIVKSMKNEKQGGKGGGGAEVRESEKEGHAATEVHVVGKKNEF